MCFSECILRISLFISCRVVLFAIAVVAFGTFDLELVVCRQVDDYFPLFHVLLDELPMIPLRMPYL